MIKWGILGAGNIAHRFCKSLAHQKDSVLYAIAARNEEKAKAFVSEFPCEKYYLDYDALLNDPEVDCIYLALPHGLHRQWAIKALNNKIAVLCEKPAVCTTEEMVAIAEAAKANNTLFMEAMKTRFVPLYREIKRLIDSKELGEVTDIYTSLCNKFPLELMGGGKTYHTQPGHGGVTLDSGTYCACWLEDFSTGPITLKKIYATEFGGIDYYTDSFFDLNGINAELEVAFERQKKREVIITTTKARLEIEEIHRPTKMTIVRDGLENEIISMPYEIDDFYGQINHFVNLLLEGKAESDIMPYAASIRNAEILDAIKDGLKFNEESLAILEKQEEILQFDHFDSATALKLGNMIVEENKKFDRELAIQIVREKDQLPIFTYFMDSKSQRNVDFINKKRNTVLKTGHSSFYPIVANKIAGTCKKVLEDKECLCSGGAFPIRVNNELVATVIVSGLHEGKDHHLVVNTIAKLLDKEVPVFNKITY